jgi:hypothetical protein
MDEALRDELIAMADADQVEARAAFAASEADERFRGKFIFQIPVEDWLPEFHRSAELARAHGVRIRQIVEAHGWPGRSMVGGDGAFAAFLLVQHAGPEVQRACLSALRGAVTRGDANPEHLAAVSDRIELESGGSQIYGTHLALDDDGEHVPLIGVVDPDRLDERRVALGLTTWAAFVAELKQGRHPAFEE